MRRLLRWTFHALAAASLLLCLATAGLWVRSHWVYDQFARPAPSVGAYGPEHVVPQYQCFVVSDRGGSAAGSAGLNGPRTSQRLLGSSRFTTTPTASTKFYSFRCRP